MTAAGDTFIIVYVGHRGYEAHIRFLDGRILSGHDFKDETAARDWVAGHAPDAVDVSRLRQSNPRTPPQ